MVDTAGPLHEIEIPGVTEDTAYLAERVETNNETLQKILDALKGRISPADTMLQVFATGTPAGGSTTIAQLHVRLRVTEILVTSDTAGLVTLFTGVARYQFYVGANSLTGVSFPLVIDPATDVYATHSAAPVNVWGLYLLGRVDE